MNAFAPNVRLRAALCIAALLALGCHRSVVPVPTLAAAAALDSAQLVARGEYIVRSVAVCGGCHSASLRDPDGPLSGGMEFRDWRLGVIRAANITPDSATGIGSWSEGEIVRALRNGERKNGRLLAPVMPYAWLHAMSDEDAAAVAHYLKSRPAVRHAVKESPNLVFKTGRALFLGPDRAPVAPAPPRAATAEYGGYLARHVGMCAECHTPRTGVQQKADMRRLLAGNAHPPKEFPANPANLTPDSTAGIGTWSEDDFVRTIRTGVNPKGDTLRAPMPWRQVRRMSDDDLRAIYRYLRTLRPVHDVVPRRAPASAAGPT